MKIPKLEAADPQKSAIEYLILTKSMYLIDSLRYSRWNSDCAQAGRDSSGGTEVCIGALRLPVCHFHQPKWREEE
jgi:hypothetical protein